MSSDEYQINISYFKESHKPATISGAYSANLVSSIFCERALIPFFLFWNMKFVKYRVKIFPFWIEIIFWHRSEPRSHGFLSDLETLLTQYQFTVSYIIS